MIKLISERRIQEDWKISVILFILLFILFDILVLCRIPSYLFGIIIFLHLIGTLILVKKKYWTEIGFNKPAGLKYIVIGSLLAVLYVILVFLFLKLLFGFTDGNYLFLMAKSQLAFGVINKTNAWTYFPMAAIGYMITSPLCEEPFYRGLLFNSFRKSFSPALSITLQAVFFGLIHVPYFLMFSFKPQILFSIPFIMIAGLINGWASHKTHSIWSCSIVHAAGNFIHILFIYLFIIPVIG